MKETVQQKIRKVFKFLQAKAVGYDDYGNNGYVELSGKKYFVGKMSYDEWYIEPYYRVRKETDAFTKSTLWEKSDTMQILELFEENGLVKLLVN